MVEPWIAALVRATNIRLTENSEPWDTRVYRDIVPSGKPDQPIVRPYVVCMFVGGGNRGGAGRYDFINALWQIKAVANDQETAFTCKGRISSLFQNADQGTAKQLYGGDFWDILSTMEERAIDRTEMVDKHRIYHSGAVFRVLMQSKQVV